MRDWKKVFSFTFRMQVCRGKYLAVTLIPALVLFLLMATLLVIDCATTRLADGAPVQTEAVPLPVYELVDLTDGANSALVDEALARAPENGFVMVKSAEGYTAVIPEKSNVTYEAAGALARELAQAEREASARALGLADSGRDRVAEVRVDAAAPQGSDDIFDIIRMILLYLCCMVMYFMVLAYGQSVAGSLMLEKTNKLMDTFLIAMRPGALVLGKTLGIALAGVLQIVAWIAGPVLGAFAGRALCGVFFPGVVSDMMNGLATLGTLTSLFDTGALLTALAMLPAGFLLYCSLSAIGGAIAGRSEDLSSCNAIFISALIVSFLLVIRSSTATVDPILYYVPFTAVLCAPAGVLCGDLTVVQGLVSLGLMLVSAVLVCLYVGRLYRLNALNHGEKTSLKSLLKVF